VPETAAKEILRGGSHSSRNAHSTFTLTPSPGVLPASIIRLTCTCTAYNIGAMAETLGTFEQAVLLSIVRLRDGAYGRGILREVEERLERDVAAGAVHATLERLEGKGLIRSRIGVGTPIRDGRAKRFYQLQPSGVQALNDARAAMKNLWHGVRWPLKI